MAFTLEQRSFGYPDDSNGYSGLYFQIFDDNKKVWESAWLEWDEFYSSPQERQDFRDALSEAAAKLGIKVEVSSDDYEDWKIV